MDITNLITNFTLGIFDTALKTYSVICRKPYVTVKVQYASQKDGEGRVTQETFALTIINESGPEADIQRVWFLTPFHRIIFSLLVDSKMPVKVRKRDRATYFFPVKELKAALNKNVSDTISEAVVQDKTGHIYSGRTDKVVQAEFAR